MKTKKSLTFLFICSFIVLFLFPCLNLVNATHIITIDSYTGTGVNGYITCSLPDLGVGYSGYGQSFTPDYSVELTAFSVKLSKALTPNGALRGYLYSHTGTYGTSDLPNTLLASADNTIMAEDLTTTPTFYNFTFSSKYMINYGTHYILAVLLETGWANGTNEVVFAGSSAHDGRCVWYGNNSGTIGWFTGNSDLAFYVYGDNDYEEISPYESTFYISPNPNNYLLSGVATYARIEQVTPYEFIGQVYNGSFLNLNGTYSIYKTSVLTDAEDGWNEVYDLLLNDTVTLNETDNYEIGIFHTYFSLDYVQDSSYTYEGWKVNGTIDGTSETFENYIVMVAEESTMLFYPIIDGDPYSSALIEFAPEFVPLKFNVQYNFKGYCWIGGLLNANGTFTVQSTALAVNAWELSEIELVSESSGTISNGILEFNIASVSSLHINLYWVMFVNVTIPDDGISNLAYEFFFYYSDSGLDTPDETATPTSTPDFSGTQPIINANFIGGLLILVVFTLLFGLIAGRDGLLAGIAISCFINALLGLFPIYSILITIVFGAVLFVSYTGIGQGGTPIK